jgi:hypothetical protein
MNLLRFILTTIFLFSFVSNSLSDELKELMLKQIDSQNFSSISDTYIEEYNSMVLSNGEYFFFNKNEMKEMLNSDVVKNAEKKIISFNITSRSETQDYVTVTYNYEYTAKMGNQNINGKIEGAGVYLKTKNGYVSIFDATTQ